MLEMRTDLLSPLCDFSLPDNVLHVQKVAASIEEWCNIYCKKCSLPFKKMLGRRKVCECGGQVAACSLLLVVACSCL